MTDSRGGYFASHRKYAFSGPPLGGYERRQNTTFPCGV